MFEFLDHTSRPAMIKVIGVGGGGSNALEHMIDQGVGGVEFTAMNTDLQALDRSSANRLQLGPKTTAGLGAGADPNMGAQAAEESRDTIYETVQGADMLFITAGMGGGTGTGSAPVIAEIAKELGILTVAVVTKPFVFEGKKRTMLAEQGIAKLSHYVDSLITIPNDKLLSVLGKQVTLLKAFKAANNILLGSVQGIAELITCPGLINVDFADVRTVMSEKGMAMMGSGAGTGEDRAQQAAESAIASPLLEDVDLTGALGVLVNITGGSDMTIGEFETVGEVVRAVISEDATVVIGTVIDSDMIDQLRVTVVVTGLKNGRHRGDVSLSEAKRLVAKLQEDLNTNSNSQIHASDYKSFDSPSVLRKQVGVKESSADWGASHFKDVDYLDIPAFLRKQEQEEHE